MVFHNTRFLAEAEKQVNWNKTLLEQILRNISKHQEDIRESMR